MSWIMKHLRKPANSTRHVRYRREGADVCIDVHLSQWRQFFNSHDPAPFRDRDLDVDAVTYIVGSFRDIRGAARSKIVLHLAESQKASKPPETFIGATHSFFAHEHRLALGKRRQTFRRGRAALLIGVLFLAICMTIAQWTSRFDLGLLGSPIREGLTILGWVAMWRPVDILLYAWWPIAETLDVYARLSEIPIDVVYDARTPDADLRIS